MDLTFVLTSLVVIATPGTGAIFTLAAALARGARSGVVAAAACTVALVPHTLAAVTGLAAVLHTSAVAFSVIKYLGVAYLLYLAVATWRGAGSLRLDVTKAPPPSTLSVFRDALLLNLLNPKLTIFFVAFLPQFVHPSGGPAVPVQMVLLSAVFAALTFVVYCAYAVVAARLRGVVVSRPAAVRRFERSTGVTFALLAGRLALAGR